MRFSIDEAKNLLRASGAFFDAEDFEEDPDTFDKFVLNMNDVWSWASADCEEVNESELCELAKLFFDYGWAGILFWVSEKNGGLRSAFHDFNRFIDFVRIEEDLKKKLPDSNKRAYKKISYRLGKK